MQLAPRLVRNAHGIAAVEFALIAPVMILMITGFMEFAHVSSARTRLEAATMSAARAVAATDCPSNRVGIMMAIIERGMANIPSADAAKVKVVTKSYSSNFGDVGEPEPFQDDNGNQVWDIGESYTDINSNSKHDTDMGSAGSIGGAGEVISYTASFEVASLFKFISNLYNGTEGYKIKASTVIRNEPIFRTTGCT